MKTYQGSCHCGSIRFSFTSPLIDQGLRCNCSLCKRKGAIMSSFTLAPEELTIEVTGDALSTYSFGKDIAEHNFCNQCGIYTFHSTLRKPGHYRVNLGCVDDINSAQLPFEVFDGASL
ncbi:aldehyde-activating protein [Endozoicomonas numazuensis]|uniref:Aldehyde-activating protein n=2 Tax=Endozoicomonas numazuensis TaxID=1137799 RepID=A0A081NMF8_9GAMM|nr:aldehyde-activating protein [Endozoicomonas numazuensis]